MPPKLVPPLPEHDTVATVAPCAHCECEVPVSTWTLAIVEMANNMLESKGEQTLRSTEIVLCAECYEKRSQRIAESTERQIHREHKLWKQFREDWPDANDRGRAELERVFLDRVGDKGFWRELLRRWTESAAKKTASRSSGAAAGFGGDR